MIYIKAATINGDCSGQVRDIANVHDHPRRILGSKMGSTRITVDVPKLVGPSQQGRLKLDELISGRHPVEQIDEAIAEFKSGGALRNVIMF